MFHTRNLSTFTLDKLSPYFHGVGPSVDMNTLRWEPLGEIGSHPLPITSFLAAADLTRPTHPYCNHPTTCHIPRPRPPTSFIPAMWDMYLDLKSHNLVSPSSDAPTGSFFIKPKANSTKLRAIFDGRHANGLFPFQPRHYTLQNFGTLKAHLRSLQPIYFHHTDICNFYWSFKLPHQLQSAFIAQVMDPNKNIITFRLLAPPFG